MSEPNEVAASTRVSPVTVDVKVARTASEGSPPVWDDAQITVQMMSIGIVFEAFKSLAPALPTMSSESGFWANLVAAPEAFFEAAGIIVGWPTDRIAALSPSSFLAVVMAIVEVYRPMYQQLELLAERISTLKDAIEA